MENCATCRFFMAQSDEHGLCRRNPPTPIKTEESIISFFPTMLNDGWCGEHKENKQ